jgi:WD40 repeat protein
MKTTLSLVPLNTVAVLACCWLATVSQLVAAEPLTVCAPGGTHLATGAEPGLIHYRQASDYAIQRTFYICHPQAICFSEDGKLLAAAGGRNGSQAKIKVWRIADHLELCQIITAGEGFNALALSSDGNLVVGASSDGRIQVCRVSDGQSQWSRILSSAVRSIRFSSNSKRVLIQAENESDRQFDAGNGRLMTDLGVAPKR